jgi:NADPH:quinone reductase-like Zn-dependent oxidoreductase
VKKVGSASGFKVGDKVITHLVPFIPDGDFPAFSHIATGMGQEVDGTLREYGVFHESSLVLMPKTISFEQAATLTCSALTAWNGLFGLKGREPKKGDWVLTQGTGGVSIAALQFAIAVGATVVATTSNEAKAARLRALGANHVINYKEDEKWGETARKMTPNGRGFDQVVDVGGNTTLAQSLKAIRVDGLVIAAGLIGGAGDESKPALLETLYSVCIVRGVLLGTRQQFHDMNRFIEENGIEPAIDDEVFGLKDTKDAYQKLAAQKHFAKVVIKIN